MMRRALQRRTKLQYAYYEDQLRNSIPQHKAAAKPKFTSGVHQKTSFSEEFYNAKDLNQALQFMQAGQTPEPKSKGEAKQGYAEYMQAAMAAGFDPSHEDPQARADGPPKEGRPPTREEQLAAAKKVTQQASALGRDLMNKATTKEFMTSDNPNFGTSGPIPENFQRQEIPYMKKDVIEAEKERVGAKPPPEFDEDKVPGANISEKEANYAKMVAEWESQDRLARNPAVAFGKKHRQPGAPVTSDWSRTDESAYGSARKAFFEENLSKPGWTKENFGAMYAAEQGRNNVGVLSTRELRGPQWQL